MYVAMVSLEPGSGWIEWMPDWLLKKDCREHPRGERNGTKFRRLTESRNALGSPLHLLAYSRSNSLQGCGGVVPPHGTEMGVR